MFSMPSQLPNHVISFPVIGVSKRPITPQLPLSFFVGMCRIVGACKRRFRRKKSSGGPLAMWKQNIAGLIPADDCSTFAPEFTPFPRNYTFGTANAVGVDNGNPIVYRHLHRLGRNCAAHTNVNSSGHNGILTLPPNVVAVLTYAFDASLGYEYVHL